MKVSLVEVLFILEPSIHLTFCLYSLRRPHVPQFLFLTARQWPPQRRCQNRREKHFETLARLEPKRLGFFYPHALGHSASSAFHFVLRASDALHNVHVATCAAVQQSENLK